MQQYMILVFIVSEVGSKSKAKEGGKEVGDFLTESTIRSRGRNLLLVSIIHSVNVLQA